MSQESDMIAVYRNARANLWPVRKVVPVPVKVESPVCREPSPPRRIIDHATQPLNSISRIKHVVAKHYGIEPFDLVSVRRKQPIAFRRQVAMYLAKTMTSQMMTIIGRHFGGRDHTTVIYAVRKVASMIASDPALAAEVEALRREIVGEPVAPLDG
jgi:hypothetical protein